MKRAKPISKVDSDKFYIVIRCDDSLNRHRNALQRHIQRWPGWTKPPAFGPIEAPVPVVEAIPLNEPKQPWWRRWI